MKTREKDVYYNFFVFDKNTSKMDINLNRIPDDHTYAVYSNCYQNLLHKSTNALGNVYADRPLVTFTSEQYRMVQYMFDAITKGEVSYVSHIEKNVLVDGFSESQCKSCGQIFLKKEIKEDHCIPCYKKHLVADDTLIYINNKQNTYIFDESYNKDQVELIPKARKGIYLFTGENNEILYIGKANDLNSRVNAHLKGVTNTKDYHQHFNNVCIMYLDNYKDVVEFVEKDLIRTLKPKYNVVYNVLI